MSKEKRGRSKKGQVPQSTQLEGGLAIGALAAADPPQMAVAAASSRDGAAFDVWRPRNLLTLTHVKLTDYVPIETVADSRFLEDADASAAPAPDSAAPQAFDKIPATFTNIEDWPIATNICCHECGFTFGGRPVFVPTFIRESGGRVEMGVSGNFCGWNCAELWIETRHAGHAVQQWRLRENLCWAYRAFTGRTVLTIQAALPRTELQQFGGDLDLDTWRRRQLTRAPELNELPLMTAQSPSSNSVWNICRFEVVDKRPKPGLLDDAELELALSDL
jgi:hypothetical protein